MGGTASTLVKLFTLALFVCVFLSSQNVARADEVFLAGSKGCFNCMTVANTLAAKNDSLLDLTHMNATFRERPAAGFRELGRNPIAPPIQIVNTLEGFSLSSTSAGSGLAFLSVNDLAITAGQIASITGPISRAQQSLMPEPATMLLLGTGLLGLAAGLRRRRSASVKKAHRTLKEYGRKPPQHHHQSQRSV